MDFTGNQYCGCNNRTRNMYGRNMYMNNNDNCNNTSAGCKKETDPVDEMTIAMCYVPWQKWRDILSYEEGFQCGTIFKELDKPFLGRKLV